MKTWHNTARVFILLAVLLTAGCNTPAPTTAPTAAPTQDLAPVMTMAAQTVIAKITEDALANPTATALPPTATEAATPTAAPTLTLAPTVTSTPVKSGGGGGGNIIYPTSTSSYTDSALIVKTEPTDGSVFAPGYDFDVIWTVKNTGKRDWTSEFYYKFIDGNWEPESKEIRYTGALDTGDTVKLVVDFQAPQTAGRYTSNWGIVNDDGVVFARMYIVIYVQ